MFLNAFFFSLFIAGLVVTFTYCFITGISPVSSTWTSRKAILKLTSKKLETLKRQKLLYEKAVTDQVSRGRFTLDQEFHASHIQISGNLYLTDYFREVYQRIFLRHRIEGLRADRARAVVSEHNEIFEAISLKDAERAGESIRFHIEAGKQYIFSVIFG